MIAYDLLTAARCEPAEVDEARPTLSWKRAATADGETPLGARVRLERLDPLLGPREVWSASVEPDEVSVRLAGGVLAPMTAYRWTVELDATDSGGFPLAPAAASAGFETGLQTPASWSASWIARDGVRAHDELGEPVRHRTGDVIIPRSWQTMYSSAPSRFRRDFTLADGARSAPVRARLYISAHGVYRAFLNGQRVGSDELTPGWTRYESRLEYQAYDVTDLLTVGENVIGAVVGDGWWSGRVGYDTRNQAEQYGHNTELIAQLVIDHADGTVTTLVTDDEWTESSGAIVMSDLLMGEYHDPSQEEEGWNAPGFDATHWRAVVATAGRTHELDGQRADPIVRLSEIEASTIRSLSGSRYLVDFGQNLVGRVRLTIRDEPAGSVVHLTHGEMCEKDGVYTANLRSAEAHDIVVTTGAAEQVFEPWFTLHGFRYLELRGLSGPPRPEDVVAVVLGSRLAEVGGIRTGSTMVEQLQSNIVWSQRGNYVGVPTDCPQRDERLGWTADTQIFARTAMFNADVKAFLARWLDDLAASQEASGRVPDVVPVPPRTSNFDEASPGWGDAAVIVPWVLYEEYGDRELLERHYPMMKAWVDWVAARNPDGLWTESLGNNFGDWLSVDEQTPHGIVAASYRIRSVDLLCRAATALGFTKDARAAAESARVLRERFVSAHLHVEGTLTGDTQTAYLFALAWHLVPEASRGLLAARLVEKLEQRGRRLTSGFLGVNLLTPVLTEIGRPDLAVALLLQSEYPSWGYSIEHGATTIWERWDGWTERAGFQDVGMNSFNHYSLGSVGEWLYRSVGGIDQAPGSIGYRRLRIAPVIARELSPVSCWHETVRGRVEVNWKVEGAVVELTVLVPPGASAEVMLPGQKPVTVGPGRHSLAARFVEPAALSTGAQVPRFAGAHPQLLAQ